MDSETKFTSKRENEWSSSDSRAESEYDISSPKSKVNVHFLESNENLQDDSTSDVNDSIKKKNMTFYNCDYDIKCDAVNYNVYTSNESQNFSVGTYAVANDKLISQTSKNTDNSVSLYDIQNSEFSNDYNQISNDSINNDNTGHPNKQIDSDMYEDINQIEDWNEKILTNCENLISNSLKNIEESKPMNDDTQKSSVYGDFLNKGAQNIIHNSEQLRLLTEQQNIHSINQFNNSQIVIENQEKLNEYKNFEVKSHYVRREKFPGNDNFAHNSFDAQYNKLIPFNPVNVNTTEKDTELNAPENKTKKEIIRRQLNNQRERVRVRDMNESFQTLKEMIEKSEDIVNKPNTKLNIIDSTIHLIKTLEKNVKDRNLTQRLNYLLQNRNNLNKTMISEEYAIPYLEMENSIIPQSPCTTVESINWLLEQHPNTQMYEKISRNPMETTGLMSNYPTTQSLSYREIYKPINQPQMYGNKNQECAQIDQSCNLTAYQKKSNYLSHLHQTPISQVLTLDVQNMNPSQNGEQ